MKIICGNCLKEIVRVIGLPSGKIVYHHLNGKKECDLEGTEIVQIKQTIRDPSES